MSGKVYRPSRRLSGEIFPLAAILALAVAVIAAFPVKSLRFVPAAEPPRPRRPVFAYVELPPGVEARLLASARVSWQVDASGVKRMRAELISTELPAVEGRGVLRNEDRTDRLGRVRADYSPSYLPAGAAADPPASIPVLAEPPSAQPFPREELLNLDYITKGTVK